MSLLRRQERQIPERRLAGILQHRAEKKRESSSNFVFSHELMEEDFLLAAALSPGSWGLAQYALDRQLW